MIVLTDDERRGARACAGICAVIRVSANEELALLLIYEVLKMGPKPEGVDVQTASEGVQGRVSEREDDVAASLRSERA